MRIKEQSQYSPRTRYSIELSGDIGTPALSHTMKRELKEREREREREGPICCQQG